MYHLLILFQPPSYRTRVATSPPVSQPPHHRVHPLHVSSRHATVTRTASAPTRESFALIHSGYKRTLALSAPQNALELHNHRRRQYPQDTTSYNTHSRLDDHRASHPLPSHDHHRFRTLPPQQKRRVPQYEPPRGARPGTIV